MDLIDFDPLTGTREYAHYDEDSGLMHIRTEQDVTGFLDLCRKKRNETDMSARGIKKGFWHYASIPPVVQLELYKKGIDICNKHQTKELLREINTNYPHLKTTEKRHAI